MTQVPELGLSTNQEPDHYMDSLSISGQNRSPGSE
jgi:hypothetical protein